MLAAAFVLLSAAHPPSYRLTNLHLTPQVESRLFLNDRGTVAGNLDTVDGAPAPFLWRNGRLTRLKGVVRVAGVNAREQLAVDTERGPGIWEAGKAVRLWPGASPDGLGASEPRALGIDDTGNLTLVRMPLGSEGGNFRVITWPKASRIPEMVAPVAFAPDGAILARSGGGNRGAEAPGRADAVLYDENSLRVVGEEGLYIDPVAAARGGWVCGALTTSQEARPRPFVWHNGRFVRPFWGAEGKAVSVNEHGEAVGIADGEPVLWVDGGAYELKGSIPENSGYRLVEALAINAKGQILAVAEPKDRPFPRTLVLLTPKGSRRKSG